MCRRQTYPPPNKQHGFTMVELVMVIVIAGVIGAVVAPRFFTRNTFDDRGFIDVTLAALHYAQKAAIAQRREVCVAFTARTVTLTIAAVANPTPPGCAPAAGCAGNPLAGPDGIAPYVVAALPNSQSAYAPLPANFSFMPLGCATVGQQIFVANYSGKFITVDAATGYAR